MDDTTFRRNRTSELQSFSAHRTSNQHDIKNDNVSTMQEVESRLHQTDFVEDKNKNQKVQNDIDQIHTIFGKRMHKRIVETIKEEKEKQKIPSSVNEEKEIAEESNKENGFRSSINNNGDKSISITRNFDTGKVIKKQLKLD